ncbi:MAG: hypothetical protein ACRENP_09410 [Longimicrobiales bacterium]
MRKTWTLTMLGGVALLMVACTHPVSKAEFDALKSDYDALETELQNWANDMHNWGTRTKNAVCDVVAKNPAAYAPATVTYCGATTGNGNPPPPPDFGS